MNSGRICQKSFICGTANCFLRGLFTLKLFPLLFHYFRYLHEAPTSRIPSHIMHRMRAAWLNHRHTLIDLALKGGSRFTLYTAGHAKIKVESPGKGVWKQMFRVAASGAPDCLMHVAYRKNLKRLEKYMSTWLIILFIKWLRQWLSLSSSARSTDKSLFAGVSSQLMVASTTKFSANFLNASDPAEMWPPNPCALPRILWLPQTARLQPCIPLV